MASDDEEPVADESPKELLERLREELKPGDGTLRGIGLGTGRVSIRFSALGLANAERLHRLYGGRVDLKVGNRPYPRVGVMSDSRVPSWGAPDPRLRVSLTTVDQRVRSGRTTIGVATIYCVSSDGIQIMDGGWFGGVTAPGSDVLAGSYSGMVTGVGHIWTLEPAESVDVRGIIGTESCLSDGSYLLAPGRYDAIAGVTVIPFEPGCDVSSQPRWTYVARAPIEIL